MNLVFETHAESADNAAGLASGWHDIGLSDRGEAQARELGARRREEPIAALYCSDLTRAWRTAELAFGDRGIPIVRDSRLRECDYGDRTRDAADAIDAARAAHVSAPFPRGESYADVAVRVGSWLRDAAARHGDDTVLVVGHRGTFYALEHLINGTPLQRAVAAPWTWQPGWTYRPVGPFAD